MPEIAITLIGLDARDRWEAAARDGLPTHSWHYAAALAAAGPAPQLAELRAGDTRLLVPFIERNWQGHRDIATPTGFAAALLLPHDATGTDLLAAWRDHARGRGWVSGYLQLSPRNPSLVAPPGDRVAAHNIWYEFDLARWDVRHDVRKKVRWSLRNGDRAGARLVTGGAALADAFLRLYPAAMARLGAEIFPPETLAVWLDDPATRLFGAELDGQITAVELCRLRGPHAELHLAGSAPDGRGLHGWLIWKMAEWFAARGVRWFNIGGYGQEGDGLHQMKRRLGGTERPQRSLRQIYDPAAYDALCTAAGADPRALYFPAYRAP